MASSSGDQNHVQHKMFLSHTGTEKDFVEQLYENLDNIYPGRIFFDKDPGSLPFGEIFPEHILSAMEKCDVAVIVMSESYFKRKWPMIELAAFVHAKSHFPKLNKKILPLFYKLSVEDFKQQERQDGWFREWENLKGSRINDETLVTWKDALQSIYPQNGIQIIPGEGEVSYRKRIVRAICDMVPPVIEYDVSHVEGKDRICTFIREKLEPFDENFSPCFFGMYAMGGMGKTTMSRVLCNEFSSEFLAKVCHVELNNYTTIDLQKKLLRTLTKWNEIDMSKLTDESQVRNLLILHVPKHRLFLVVDNVWDQLNSREAAKSFLLLPFKKGSVVLVTARSIEILNLFKNIITWEDCFSTPFLDTPAATNLFLNSAGYTLSKLEPKDQSLTITFVHSCWFSMSGSLGGREYHPLALRVLGGYVGQYMGPWENLKIDFKSVGENEKIDPLFSVLEIGWEALSTNCQSMFLDLVQFITHYGIWTCEMVQFTKWYCTIFDVDEKEVRESLEILKRRSILNLDDKWGQIFLSVHDLYREFATLNANTSTHLHSCILHGRGHGERYQKKRLTIRGSNIINLTKQGLCECSTDVEILRVVGCDHLTKVDLRGMKDLLSIELLHCKSLEQVCLDDLQNLVWLDIFERISSMILSIKGLVSLQVLKLCANTYDLSDSKSTVCELPDLLHCTSLVELEIQGYPELLEFPDLSNSKKLRRLIGENCSKTKRLPGLSNLVELQHLNLRKAGLIDIHGLDVLNKLEELDMTNCFNLKAIPNLGSMGLTLRYLNLQNCRDLEFVPCLSKLSRLESLHLSRCIQVQEIHGVDQLQNLNVLNCSDTSIRYLPDLSMLTKLCTLDVSKTPILHIGNLPKNLWHFVIVECPNFKQLPDLSKLSRLEHLNLSGCKQVQEIFGVDQLQNLNFLNCSGTSIRYLPDLSMLTKLGMLDVSKTPILHIGNIPKNLWHFVMVECPNFKQLPDLSKLGHLEHLILSGCKQVQEIHGVDQLQNLNFLNCSGTSIRYLPDMSMLTKLRTLDVSKTPILHIGDLPKNLCRFVMAECPNVKQLPNLSKLSCLKNLNLSACKQLQAIHGVDQLQNLNVLNYSGTSIKYLPDLGMLTKLDMLIVSKTQFLDIDNLPKNLRRFVMAECPNVEQLPDLSKLSFLEDLNLSGCKEVQEIHGVDQLQNLNILNCSGTSIRYLPDLSMLTNLDLLDMSKTPILDIGNLPKNLQSFFMGDCPNVGQLLDLMSSQQMETIDTNHSHNTPISYIIDQQPIDQGHLH